MIVSLIAAVAQNGTIGRNNDLPWSIKDDMRFFVQKTKGHPVIMGRRNFDSMGKPLPGRQNIVVSRNSSLQLPGCEVSPDLPDALRRARASGTDEAFVIGGAEIYRLALPFADRFYRTRVLADVPGDVTFPEFDAAAFDVIELFRGERDDRNEHAFVVEELRRRSQSAGY